MKLSELLKQYTDELIKEHDDFSNELSDKLYDIYSLCDFY